MRAVACLMGCDADHVSWNPSYFSDFLKDCVSLFVQNYTYYTCNRGGKQAQNIFLHTMRTAIHHANAMSWSVILMFCICIAAGVNTLHHGSLHTKCIYAACFHLIALLFSRIAPKRFSLWQFFSSDKHHRKFVPVKRLVVPLCELAALLTLFYVCDRTNWIEKSSRKHSLSAFIALCSIALFAAILSCKSTSQSKNTPRNPEKLFLSRAQTDEWKGWMQLLILWYHYFNVQEAYPLVRVCIASYVWLTGYGNFRYFHATGDLSVRRLLRILWRINFFPLCLSVTLKNQWMLYYICALHTVYMLFVYLTLALYRKGNTSQLGYLSKIGIVFALVAIVWDVLTRHQFDTLWHPLRLILGFNHVTGRHVGDCMHEWHFRSKLDHFAWVWGMLIALYSKKIAFAINRIQCNKWKQMLAFSLCALILSVYSKTAWGADKYAYNRMHPHISIAPVLSYVVLRNLSKHLQGRSLCLLQWVGTLSLECYVAQFHIWMATVVENGSPKFVLAPFARRFHWALDFALFSILHFGCAYRIFCVTETLKDIVLPK